jgi:hypothetical protein
MRSFLSCLNSMVRDPARSIVLAVALFACGGADRKFAEGAGGSKNTGGAGGSAGSLDGGTGGSRDASVDGKGGTAGSKSDAGFDGSGGSGGEPEDSGPPPPPPPPGRPGISIVAGGTQMSSSKYKAWVAAGESPGSNGVLASPSYRLHGGVVGTTQPK